MARLWVPVNSTIKCNYVLPPSISRRDCVFVVAEDARMRGCEDATDFTTSPVRPVRIARETPGNDLARARQSLCLSRLGEKRKRA